MDIKAGWKTTEFWLAIICLLFGLGLISYGTINKDPAASETGQWLAGIALGGYSMARGLAKLKGS